METLHFKTNINCSGCIANVTPALNTAVGIENWKVDTSNADKILTVNADNATEEEVINAVKKAGYKIEPIK